MKNAIIILVMFAAMLISSTAASAAIVARHAGPTDFNITNFDYVRLADCNIVQEGSVYLEFKPDILSDGYIWTYANQEDPVGAGFYHISVKFSWAGEVSVAVVDKDGYVFAGGAPGAKITLDGQWHSIKVWWKVGETFFMQVDDNNVYQFPNYPVLSGGPSNGHHELGRNAAYNKPDMHGDMYYGGQIRNVCVTDKYGVPIVTVVHSSGSTQVEEGRTSDSFTVQLSGMPSADVTITLDPETEDIKLATKAVGVPYDLVFTKINWNVPQTVLVSAYDDAIDEDMEDAWIRLSSASSDPNFNNRAIPLIITSVIDNDERKTAFVESGGSTEVAEHGETSDTYTVVISNMPPTADVTVDIADKSNPKQVTLSPAQLNFSKDNWNVPQTVTVKAIDDKIGEMANHQTTLSHIISSTDLAYNGVVTNLNVNIADNDIFRTPIIAKHLLETNFDPSAGPPYGKKLPDISLLAEGTVYLEFKMDTYNSGTLWMVDNDQFEIGIGVDATGFAYVNASNKTLGQNLWYDQEPLSDIGAKSSWYSLYVSWPTGPKPVDNWGRFVLDGKDVLPAGITDINLNNYDFTGITNPSTAGGNHTIGTNPSAANHNFNGQIRNLLVSNVYIPSLLIKVIHSSGATQVNEDGKTSDSFTVQLRQAPTADVTLTLTPDTNDIKLESNELVFTKDNWNITQTVTVTANDDAIVEKDESLLISISAASTDANFHNRAFLPIVVNVTDNDAKN